MDVREGLADGPLSGRRAATGFVHGAGGELLQMLEQVDLNGNTCSTVRLSHDGSGNVVAVSDRPRVRRALPLLDYGVPHVTDGSGAPLPHSAIGNPHLFGSRWFDSATELYSDGAAAFDPHAGRSLARDGSGGTADLGDNPQSPQVTAWLDGSRSRDPNVESLLEAACPVPGPACATPAYPVCRDGKWICIQEASGPASGAFTLFPARCATSRRYCGSSAAADEGHSDRPAEADSILTLIGDTSLDRRAQLSASVPSSRFGVVLLCEYSRASRFSPTPERLAARRIRRPPVDLEDQHLDVAPTGNALRPRRVDVGLASGSGRCGPVRGTRTAILSTRSTFPQA